ncbi:hypothetical protein [Roseibium suaedae]|uniref:Capsular polysaccharide transport system permease protein n=1 Tax=Roseibium suaedae TaxID=735517 RepID=A0A1M7P6E2_9HYPH|nr:hypothetical protein [Roseibium suaedae]SHN12253.1 capsular polysaccharide transport system permease protein [Roseibium suaedae]
MSIEAHDARNNVIEANAIEDEDSYFDEEFDRQHPILKYITKKATFFAFVVIPALFCAAYYGMIASNQYMSETRMIVRTIGVSEQFDTSEKREGQSIIGGDSLTQDAYIVDNYIHSAEMVEFLDKEIGLRQMFSGSEIDRLSRLSADAPFEKLHKYWNRHIDTYVDGPSGILILRVRAFSPDDSLKISHAALKAAEEMVNRLSDRAKADLTVRAENDVVKSLEDYNSALNDLRQYQNETGIFDPISEARLSGTIVAKLLEEKLKIEVELAALEAANAGDSAKARQLRRNADALQRQMDERQESLAGQKAVGGQLTENLAEFSRLETRRAVAEAIYKASARNLDTAKAAAIRRTTFIAVFSQPYLPQDTVYPARMSAWFIFTIGMLAFWSTATLIWMSVEDHRV